MKGSRNGNSSGGYNHRGPTTAPVIIGGGNARSKKDISRVVVVVVCLDSAAVLDGIAAVVDVIVGISGLNGPANVKNRFESRGKM